MGVLQPLGPGRCARVMTQANHDQVMGGDDQRELTTRTLHVVGACGDGQLSFTIDPEKAAVNGPMIGRPGGSDGPFTAAFSGSMVKDSCPSPQTPTTLRRSEEHTSELPS